MSAKIKNMVVEVPFVNNNMELRTTDGTRVFPLTRKTPGKILCRIML